MHSCMLEKNKNTTWSKWRTIFSRKVTFCKGMLPIKNEYSVCLRHALCTLWMKVFVCIACSFQLELFLQEKDACLIVLCRMYNLQCFRCRFQVLGKRPKVETFFMSVETLVPTQGNLCREVEVDWRLEIEGLEKTSSIHRPAKLQF